MSGFDVFDLIQSANVFDSKARRTNMSGAPVHLQGIAVCLESGAHIGGLCH